MELSKGKSIKIQILRGLAIIAVVCIHNIPGGLTQVFCRPFVNFAVGLFLFLSGLLSRADNWHPSKRIIKVIIPYIIWTCIYVVLLSVGSFQEIPSRLISGLLLGKTVSIMYYIFVYCQFTLLIPLIDKLARSKMKYIGFVIAPIEIIVLRLLPIVIGFEIGEPIKTAMGLYCLPWFTFFYIGFLLGNNYIKIKASAKSIALLLFTSIILQFAEGYLYFIKGVSECGTQLKLSAILSTSLFVMLAYKYIVNDRFNKEIKPLRILGDYSFGIYFSHMAIMGAVSRLIPFYDGLLFPIKILIVILVTFLCVFVGRKILGKYAKYLAL